MAAQAPTGGPPASGAGERASVALIAWPALAMMMVASVGSIAQLSDSATFGLGAVTVYLIPALLFLLPVGPGLGRARDQPRGRHLRLGPRGVR